MYNIVKDCETHTVLEIFENYFDAAKFKLKYFFQTGKHCYIVKSEEKEYRI